MRRRVFWVVTTPEGGDHGKLDGRIITAQAFTKSDYLLFTCVYCIYNFQDL